MKLKNRFAGVSIVLAVVPLLAACFFVGVGAYNSGKEALQHEVENNLISRRNMKKAELISYLSTIEKQVTSQAFSSMFIDAARDLRNAYRQLPDEVELRSDDREKILNYYTEEFLPNYKALNAGKQLDMQALLAQIDATGIGLQARYIADNPNPLGKKDGLDSANDNTFYNQAHLKYHPAIRHFLEQFGYYDIFIVEPDNGTVIYSVFKELDFATSLVNGPYSNTGLAEVFRKGKELGNQRKAVFTKFEPYLPSYEGAASFVASPIIENGERIAILIFQMPIDEINSLMTFDGKWQEFGLGASGETYLVGSDKKLLSNSRFFIEDKAGFLESQRDNNLSEQTLSIIDNKDTPIGILPIDSDGVSAALAGETGFKIFEDYRGVPVASAYTPVDYANFHWGILSEIDEAEAFAAIGALKNRIFYSAVSFALLALVLAALVGYWLARKIASPIVDTSKKIQAIASNNDLTITVEEQGDEEVAALAKAVNDLVAKLQANFSRVTNTVTAMNTSAHNLDDLVQEMDRSIKIQESECHQVATAATEMQQTAAEVAQAATKTAAETQTASDTTQNADAVVESAAENSVQLSEELVNTGETMECVAKESETIGSVLDVIQGVAEQTNLLALNAAIEAARAGEQGRGFAVVADEVRQLAQRTQQATTEIEQIITKLQESSQKAVVAMHSSHEKAEENVAGAKESNDALKQLSSAISNISEMNIQVATAAEEQSAVVEEISRNVNVISDAAVENSDRTNNLKNMSDELNTFAEELHHIVEQYKVE